MPHNMNKQINKPSVSFCLECTHQGYLWILWGKHKFPLFLSLFLSALFQRTPISHCDRKEWPSWFHGSLPGSKVLEKGIFTDRKKAQTSSNTGGLVNLQSGSPWRCINFVKLELCIHNFLWQESTASTWKQPRYPPTDEWVKKLWYIYTMEYYSVIKRNTWESVLMRWMNLEPVIQSEVSQKNKYCILMHEYGI